jgi:hypothetical protein
MSGTKYGVYVEAAPIYRVTKDNPIVDPEKNWTLDEVKNRLCKLVNVMPYIPAGNERKIVLEEIERLEGIIKENDH